MTAAAAVFGDRLELATRYADLLATEGIEHGLIGPRERDRLWDRHLLNCAVVSELLPEGARVVDVGSGAGLPGLVLACLRPDVQVDLVEPLQRRCDFLTAAVATLELTGVRVVRGRADEPVVRRAVGDAHWVTARAVAPLDRLVRWCMPLLQSGGSLLALKGARAEVELSEHRSSMAADGAGEIQVVLCGEGVLDEPTRVVRVQKKMTT